MSLGWVQLGGVPHLSCSRQTTHAPLEPEEKRGPEGMRCLLTPMSQDDALGFLPFNTGHTAVHHGRDYIETHVNPTPLSATLQS